MPVTGKITAKQAPKPDLLARKRSVDPGEWAYDHRVGLCVTVIVYLVAGIVFMTAQILVGGRGNMETISVEFVEQIPVQPDPTVEDAQLSQSDDFSNIRNRISNQNADPGEGSRGGGREAAGMGLNAALRDDRGTAAGDIYDEAAAVQQRSAANRRAYEAGLQGVEKMSNREPRTSVGSQKGSADTRVRGNVTVSFSLNNPLRQSADLFIPAYLCQGGGEIIVAITVNRNGDVVAATQHKASSSVDECMRSAALDAALKSRFNVDPRAPERQQGTITYIFIPQ